MQRRRQGFTLVELLVAMALIMFIMAILSQAFVTATQTFRDLKSAGDAAEKLRSTTGIMRRYLAADHFEGKRRLSDPKFWQGGPPREGFFRVWHGTQSKLEGGDLDGIPSFRSTTHILHFTAKLRGNQRNDYFTATPIVGSPLPGLPPTATASTPGTQFLWQAQAETRYEDSRLPSKDGLVYNWQWAEVAFFLRATNDNANGIPLYGLYLRHQLAVPDNGSGVGLAVPASQQTTVPGYLEVSCQPDPSGATSNLYFNSPLDLTMPVRRFGMTSGNLAGLPFWTDPLSGQLTYPIYAEQESNSNLLAAADLLLSNVISFDVRLLTAQPPTIGLTGGPYAGANWDAFEDLFQLTSSNRLPNSYPYNSNPFNSPTPPFSTTAGPLVFDTWTNNRDDTFVAPPLTSDYTNWTASIPILNNNDPTNPKPITIRAVQVTLRIWDEKTQQTRQVTFVQEL